MTRTGDFVRAQLAFHVPRNLLANRLVRPFPAEELTRYTGLPFRYLDATSAEYLAWLAELSPRYPPDGPLSKKPLEFYGTYRLLELRPEDALLDAAGGGYTYVHLVPVRERYLHDLRIDPRLRQLLGPTVTYLEGDAAAIPLPDASVDKISCHHSFEHFEGGTDTRFIVEVQRLLRPGGRACILPLFVADHFYELTTHFTLAKRYDPRARPLIDPTARLPGNNGYCRIYDPEALRRRVLEHIDRSTFDAEIVQMRIDGKPVPDCTLPRNRDYTAINCPFRALLITRRLA